MRVGQSGTSPAQGKEVSGTKQSSKGAAAQEAKRSERGSDVEKTSHNGANTEISHKSKEFANAKAVASETADVREEKVAELKRRIADGSYAVDHEAIADRMVDEHLKMPHIG